MRSIKFRESKIIKALKEYQLGRSVGEISRELDIDNSTFYYWCKKNDGMEQQKLKRLKKLEAENNKLKKLNANVILDNKMLKDILLKKF